jgi:hypothetical protein
MSDRLKNYKHTDANLYDALLYELMTECNADAALFRMSLEETFGVVVRDYRAGKYTKPAPYDPRIYQKGENRMKDYKPTDDNLYDALLYELIDSSGDLKVFRENLRETISDVVIGRVPRVDVDKPAEASFEGIVMAMDALQSVIADKAYGEAGTERMKLALDLLMEADGIVTHVDQDALQMQMAAEKEFGL